MRVSRASRYRWPIRSTLRCTSPGKPIPRSPRIIYKSYPVYHPSREPAAYIDRLKSVEPDVAFNAFPIESFRQVHKDPGAFSTLCYDAVRIGLQRPPANQIVMPIHRSRFGAVPARPVAGERNEKSLNHRSVAVAAQLRFSRFACIPKNRSLPCRALLVRPALDSAT